LSSVNLVEEDTQTEMKIKEGEPEVAFTEFRRAWTPPISGIWILEGLIILWVQESILS